MSDNVVDLTKHKVEKVPQINLGPDFDSLKPDERARYLKKLASSLNHALDTMQKERNELLSTVDALKLDLVNSENSLEIQKSIVLQAITEHNQEKQNLVTNIQELQSRVRAQDAVIERLNSGDND